MALVQNAGHGKLSTQSLAPEDIYQIIVAGDSVRLVAQAERLGERLSHRLTTAQIRNVFGTVRQIEMGWRRNATQQEKSSAIRQLMLLKPKLAYQATRERGGGVQELADILSAGIDLVEGDRERFQNLVDFFEAILAYHVAAGGR